MLLQLDFRPAQGTLILNPRRLATIAVVTLTGALTSFTSPREALASALEFQSSAPMEILLAQRAIADSTSEERATNPPEAPYDSLSPPPPKKATEKSTGKAFTMNLLIPGTGHLYAGYKSGWINLGIEGLTWVTYFYYHDLGIEKENQFEGFADENWLYGKWESECPDVNGQAACDQAKAILDGFIETNEQQYYEDIGKLPVYFTGWDDYDPATEDSADRHYYRGIRADSNNFLKNSRYALIVGFVNRIVSAVDVLRLMKKDKEKVELSPDTSLKFDLRAKPFNRENAFAVKFTKNL